MSEQNEVVIRKVHDGYLVELLDCPLAYTFSSQDEAERFIGPVWQRLDYVKDLHSQALRAENARLREALEEMAGNLMGSPKRKLMLSDDDFWQTPGEHTLRQWLARVAVQPERGKP